MVQSRPSLAGGLHWVRGELDQSLARARGLIEQYMDAPEDQLPLQQAAVELHQVRGTAAMIQCVGVATLADEMKHSLQDLMQGRITEPETVYAALLGASVQLGDYIDALSSGAEDCVLVFQPVINELRLARKQGVLTDAELLAEHIRALGHGLSMPDGPNRREGAAQTSARKYLPAFQASLLQWLKSQDRELALGRMGKIADHLAAITQDAAVYQLWRVFAAAVESLLSDSMDEALEFKRLFGRVGQQIKLLGEQGEAAAAPGAAALSYQFLYYIGRGRGVGPRTTLLRRAFALDANLPSAERVDQLRNKIGGPNTQLLTRLAEEIRVDFSEVKDAIDLVVRAGAKAPDDLSKIVERLQRIGHTLNMLGLRTLEQVIGNQSKALAALGPEDTEASRKVWMDAATALLRVEHSLEGALFHQLHNPGGAKALQPEEEYEDRSPHSADLRDSIAALLRESLVDLAKLKSHVDNFLKTGDASGLDQAPRMLNEVQSGLRILESERAADLCSDLRRYTLTDAFQNLNSAPGQADRFADSIACIEYYLEARQQRQPDADLILDDLQAYVAQLQFDAEPAELAAADAPAVAPAVDEAALQVDPEIREVFLEEAGEVLGQLSGQMPLFRRDPEHPEALIEIRRAFHTLKGSGRMVGAITIGEFGWAVENLLNRCLDGSRPVSSPVVELVDQALTALPVLVDKFRDAVPADADAQPVIARAEALLKGDASPSEPDMAEIFRNDAREHLTAVRAWLDGHPQGTDAPVEMELIRHLHTVRGGAAVIEAEPIQQLAGALEEYLEGARAADLALDSAGLQLLDEATGALQGWIEQAGQPGAFGRGLAEPWLQRIAALQAAMPEHARAMVADRSLVDVFCNEALTLLQEVEQTSRHWQAHPDADQQAQRLQRQFQSLAAAANGANCEPLATAAQAFADQLPQVQPTEPFFDEFTSLLEELFGLLDDYRNGHLKNDGGQFATRIRSLGDNSETSGPETGRAAPTPAPAAATELPMPPEPSEEGPDPELVEIFRGEAEELLEELDRQFDAWERDPSSDLPLQEIARALHTLKGSARMAEQFDIGEVGHRLEGLLERAAAGERPRNSALFALCHNVVDGLYHALEAIKRDQQPDLQGLLAELADFASDGERAAVAEELHDPEAPASELTLGDGQMVEMAGSASDDVIEIDSSLLEDSPSSAAGGTAADDDAAAADAGPSWSLDDSDDAPAAEIERAEAPDDGAEQLPTDALEWPAAESTSVADEALGEEITLESPADDAESTVDVTATADDAAHAAETDGDIEIVDSAGLDVGEADALELDADDAAGSDAAMSSERPAGEIGTEGAEPAWGSSAELAADTDTDTDILPGDAAASAFAPDALPEDQANNPLDGDDGLERELVEIFTGEAAELLELMQSMLQRWTSEPQDQHAIAEMQRALHTFKGGARMAGLQQMADVSHDMETAVNQMASGQLPTDLRQFGELHATLEQLQGLHDGVVRDFNISLDAHLRDEPAAGQAGSFRSPMAPDAPQGDEALVEPELDDEEPAVAPGTWDERLFWTPETDDAIGALRRETARVAVEALDSMLNQAGEISIYRSRLEQQNSAIQFQLDEMAQTINRVRDQLRQLDAETDAQIEARGLTAAERAEQGEDRYAEDFDPLEMDRYSRMQELSRALSESVNDLSSLHTTMDGVMDESEALLLQQGRVNTEVQQGLMRTLMVPFSRQVQRLQRVVRQVAEESVKKVQVQFSGVEAELDRNVLERMTAPLEHLLRNAVVHGIELPAQRVQTGKSEQGTIKLELFREGTQLVIELSDDGAGLNIDAIRTKAVERGLMPEDADVDDRAIAQFIFEPGFSTAAELTQSAGRGVGMDVVAAEVKQLGGTLELGSERGRGTRFIIRLPLTLAISQALLIGVGAETYAVSLSSIEGISRIPTVEVDAFLKQPERQYQYGGQEYQVHYLGDFLSLDRPEETEARTLPAILVKVGEGLGGEERHIAVVVDALFGNREVVSKAVGPQVSSILGISGATILADGRVVLILDVPALVQDRTRRELLAEAGKTERSKVESDDRETVMVVDDSITMRRVAERLLGRNGYKVITAKDGLDAIAQLQTESPQVILLDIEMPRADGFEVATFIRNTDRIASTPIIMITSRSGDKHRERAAEIGVNRYLIKPYQEEQLMNEVRSVTAEA